MSFNLSTEKQKNMWAWIKHAPWSESRNLAHIFSCISVSFKCISRRRRNKAAGFALKVLEDNFPKQTGKMRDFYGWAKDGNSEHDLLKSIVGSFKKWLSTIYNEWCSIGLFNMFCVMNVCCWPVDLLHFSTFQFIINMRPFIQVNMSDHLLQVLLKLTLF